MDELIFNRDIGRVCMVRTNSAGVFFGTLEACNGRAVRLSNARRVWYWAGAATLSQLAMDGTSRPLDCKFPMAVDEIVLTEVIEIIPMRPVAIARLGEVPIWTQDGSGYGDGCGSGDGDGHGYGSGDGYGDGYGCDSG